MLWIPMIAGLAIIVSILTAKIRSDQSEWGSLISVSFMIIILLSLLPKINEVVAVFSGLAAEANVGSMYLAPVLKTIAIAYITSFGSQISKDAGEDGIASIVELAGKIIIILVALPVMQAILYSLFQILG